jgi:hypothetical protein
MTAHSEVAAFLVTEGLPTSPNNPEMRLRCNWEISQRATLIPVILAAQTY